MNKLEYTVELLTPAITAKSGTIGKEVDVTVKRDINGKSYYSGKHIKGILRSKVLAFKNALDKDGNGIGIEFTNKYFGSSGKEISKLRFSNLIMEKETVEDTENEIGYRYGVKINRKTKVAEDNSLFSYEFVKPKNIYKGYIEFGYIEKDDLRFILASLFHVDKIGGLKSRGLGKVEVKIEGEGIEKLEELVNKYLDKSSEIKSSEINREIGKLKKYKYELKFEEPVVLQGRYTKNEIEVRNSLQGSTIRGALIQYGLDRGVNIDKLLNISVDEVRQFKNDKEEIKLASFFETKYPIGKKYEKVDKVVYLNSEYEGIKLERGSLGLLKATGSEISIKIDEKTRTTEESMLFNTEYIELKKEDNIKFVGNAEIPEGLFEENEEKELQIGKFKSKGFGKVTIKFSKYEPKTITKDTIKEKIKKLNEKIQENEKVDKTTITFDFMSDLILPMNQVKNIGEEIKSLLDGIGEHLILDMKRSFVNIEKYRGYNIVNNMRKADEIIIKSGSVLTYQINTEIDNIIDKLVKIEEKGLGLRKNEGFGLIEICSKEHILDKKN